MTALFCFLMLLLAFLLENGSMYHIAHSSAIIEYLVTIAFAPSIKQYHYVTVIGNEFAAPSCQKSLLTEDFPGILLVIVGQTLRSTAMIHAATSFSHSVQFRKLETHTLVTSGVYGYLIHSTTGGLNFTNPLQIFPTSLIRGILLLGTWNTASSSKPA